MAVWTGSEMIIWGGTRDSNGIVLLNNGGRYNPAGDSWVAMNSTGAPAGRLSCTAVWTGSEMIIWGGNDNRSSLNNGGRYNAALNSW